MKKGLIQLRALLLVLITTNSIANSDVTKQKLKELEASSGGRLGISATNTANNERIEYRASERFPMNCTSKVLGVSAVLKESMSKPALLQKRLKYTQHDVDSAGWAPITQKHIADGMTISQLSGAAIMQSDNTAMNLLMKELGGLGKANQINRRN